MCSAGTPCTDTGQALIQPHQRCSSMDPRLSGPSPLEVRSCPPYSLPLSLQSCCAAIYTCCAASIPEPDLACAVQVWSMWIRPLHGTARWWLGQALSRTSVGCTGTCTPTWPVSTILSWSYTVLTRRTRWGELSRQGCAFTCSDKAASHLANLYVVLDMLLCRHHAEFMQAAEWMA